MGGRVFSTHMHGYNMMAPFHAIFSPCYGETARPLKTAARQSPDPSPERRDMAAKRTKPLTVDSEPPDHLMPESSAWFRSIVKSYGVADEYGLLALRGAMEAFDRGNAARLILEKEGMVTVSKYGDHRSHPCIGIVKDAEKNMLAFLRAMSLDVEPTRPGPGRPPGRA
jgi:phage terminase small subunit